MPSGGTAFDASTYKRKVELLSNDGSTLVATLCDLSTGTNVVESCEFQWLRQGGCGSGSLKLAKGYDYTDLTVGRLIRCSYSSTAWYLGRIQQVDRDDPSGISVSMNGLIGDMAEVFVGGTGYLNSTVPLRLARNDYYVNDPNHAVQSAATVTTIYDAVDYLYTNYLDPIGIGLGSVPAPSTDVSIYSLTFSGEQSIAEIMRVLAEGQYNSSYGIDANGDFFFIPLDEGAAHLDTTSMTPQAEWTRNLDVTSWRKTVDREGMINRIALIGGYVYDASGAFYRYSGIGQDDTSVASFGARGIEAYVPFIRNNKDAQIWADGVFRRYSGPRTQYAITTKPQGAPLYPWSGPVKLWESAGGSSIVQHFDEVQVVFDHAPYFSFNTGPEKFQYAPAPEAETWELGSGSGGGGDNSNIPPDGTPFDEWTDCTGVGSVDACTSDQAAYEYTVTLTGIGAVTLRHSSLCNWTATATAGGDTYSITLLIGGNGPGLVELEATRTDGTGTDYSVTYSSTEWFRELCCNTLTKTGGYASGAATVEICAGITEKPDTTTTTVLEAAGACGCGVIYSAGSVPTSVGNCAKKYTCTPGCAYTGWLFTELATTWTSGAETDIWESVTGDINTCASAGSTVAFLRKTIVGTHTPVSAVRNKSKIELILESDDCAADFGTTPAGDTPVDGAGKKILCVWEADDFRRLGPYTTFTLATESMVDGLWRIWDNLPEILCIAPTPTYAGVVTCGGVDVQYPASLVVEGYDSNRANCGRDFGDKLSFINPGAVILNSIQYEGAFLVGTDTIPFPEFSIHTTLCVYRFKGCDVNASATPATKMHSHAITQASTDALWTAEGLTLTRPFDGETVVLKGAV